MPELPKYFPKIDVNISATGGKKVKRKELKKMMKKTTAFLKKTARVELTKFLEEMFPNF